MLCGHFFGSTSGRPQLLWCSLVPYPHGGLHVWLLFNIVLRVLASDAFLCSEWQTSPTACTACCSHCARHWLCTWRQARWDNQWLPEHICFEAKPFNLPLCSTAELFRFAGGSVKLQTQRTRRGLSQASARETMSIRRPAFQVSCPCIVLPYCGLAAAIACVCFWSCLCASPRCTTPFSRVCQGMISTQR